MNDNDDFQVVKSNPRRTYLITYSQAKLEKSPTRLSFGNAIQNTFNAGNYKAKTEYWACALENHKNGGVHYHVSLKLSSPRGWGSIRTKLYESHDINVNFSSNHEYYYSAYKYICKSDENVVHSNGHPNLKEISSPRTKKCMASYKRKHSDYNKLPSKHRESKIRRLSNVEVSEFMVENNIKTDTELAAMAHKQKKCRKERSCKFCAISNFKIVAGLDKKYLENGNCLSHLGKKKPPTNAGC